MPQTPKFEQAATALRTGTILLALSFMSNQSCRPRIVPEPEHSACFAGGIDSVPIIAAVRIAPGSSHPVGPPVTGESPFAQVLVQLVRVDVDIENVLKGDLPLGHNSVYYFIPTKVSGHPLISLFVTQTSRLLLCLRKDSGKLRVASDYNTHSGLHIMSGFHPALRPEHAEPVANSVVNLLLTPGEGADVQQMMDAILASELRMLPVESVAPKLLEIAATATPDLAAAACLRFREAISDNYAPNEQVLTLNRKLGVRPQDVVAWQALSSLRAGLASDWWKPSDLPASTLKMEAPRDPESTLRFCRSDAALRIRPPAVPKQPR